ncbi:MAG: hypothetical protein L0Y71_11795 [Gemmataceae bacterium]|nr:hypothetical protein [Gemmataceae bacterium]
MTGRVIGVMICILIIWLVLMIMMVLMMAADVAGTMVILPEHRHVEMGRRVMRMPLVAVKVRETHRLRDQPRRHQQQADNPAKHASSLTRCGVRDNSTSRSHPVEVCLNGPATRGSTCRATRLCAATCRPIAGDRRQL